MIAYVKGKLVLKNPNHVILDVSGIGYSIRISTQTFSALPAEGADMKLYTHHHFSEADQSLFGFTETDEKSLFELLLTVKGIGPRLGLTILSGMNSEEITDTIMRQDVLKLSKISGIGKKTAERMVLELKDKLGGVTTEQNGTSRSPMTGLAQTETLSALEALGYRKSDAESAVLKAVKTSETPLEDVSSLLKATLKVLA
ncbi:MAG: Holliday junction branch migration protein RuvA [Balneolales bacterium]